MIKYLDLSKALKKAPVRKGHLNETGIKELIRGERWGGVGRTYIYMNRLITHRDKGSFHTEKQYVWKYYNRGKNT
jgi:hypothetical protein